MVRGRGGVLSPGLPQTIHSLPVHDTMLQSYPWESVQPFLHLKKLNYAFFFFFFLNLHKEAFPVSFMNSL